MDKIILAIESSCDETSVAILKNDKENVILEDTIKTNEEVLQLIEKYKDYKIKGDCSYLGIESELPNEIEGLKSFKSIVSPCQDVLAVKPVYLKDNYGI